MLEQPTTQLKKYFNITGYGILILIILILSIKGCILSRQKTKLQNDLVTAHYNNNMVFSENKHKDEIIVAQNQLIADKSNEIVKHIEKENKLLSLQSQVVTKTVFRVDSVLVPYTDTIHIYHVKTNDSTDIECLPLPSRAELIQKDYQIDETVTSEGILINHLSVPDSTTNIIGDAGNLFQSKPTILVKHSNTHVKTVSMKNIVTQPKVSKPVKTFLIGGAVGVALDAIATGLFYFYTHK